VADLLLRHVDHASTDRKFLLMLQEFENKFGLAAIQPAGNDIQNKNGLYESMPGLQLFRALIYL
jgi:hypothetical protein